jgi:hypothetical protein
LRHFQLDPDKPPPRTLREVADNVHDLGKALDSPCHPFELQDQRDIGATLKYLAGWLHGMAAKAAP